jgi:hypothetical protein
MSYNGSGTFQINSSGQPVITGTTISSTVFNALTADLATGLSTAMTKDGQTTTTARIPFALGINSTLVTDATTTTSGSIITAGGVGIAKALYVGTTANVAGAVTLGGVATFSAQPIFSSLTASSAVATDASKGLVSVTNTGTGNNVLATGPTISGPIISDGTANGVSYLNGSKVLTTGTALVFDGTNLGVGQSSPVANFRVSTQSSVDGNSGAYIENTSTGTSASAVVKLKNSGTTNAYTGLGSTTRSAYGGVLGANVLAMYTDNAAGAGILVDAAGPITFGTNSLLRASINSAGAWNFGATGTNTGTSGQVLSSQGSASPPTWATAGTVTSVSGTGTTSGLTLSGTVTTTGSLTLSGTATVASLTTASGSAPSYSARVWVNFNGTGTPAIIGSGNASSITDNGIGDYTVNFTTAIADTNYSVETSCRASAANAPRHTAYNTRATTSVQVFCCDTAGAVDDPTSYSVSVYR